MIECMQTCQKLQDSRATKIENKAEFKSFLKKIADVARIPGTKTLYPNGYQAAWLAVTDEKEEGIWLDWYSEQEIDLLDSATGKKLGKAKPNTILL